MNDGLGDDGRDLIFSLDGSHCDGCGELMELILSGGSLDARSRGGSVGSHAWIETDRWDIY